jgi:hypothetical protein
MGAESLAQKLPKLQMPFSKSAACEYLVTKTISDS